MGSFSLPWHVILGNNLGNNGSRLGVVAMVMLVAVTMVTSSSNGIINSPICFSDTKDLDGSPLGERRSSCRSFCNLEPLAVAEAKGNLAKPLNSHAF